MEKLNKVVKFLIVLNLAVALVVLVNVAIFTNAINQAAHPLIDCKGNGACLPSQLLAITGSIRSTLGVVARTMPEISKSIGEASSNSAEASKATITTANEANRLLLSANSVVGSLSVTMGQLQTSLEGLTLDTRAVLLTAGKTTAKAGLTFDQLTELLKDTQAQIDAGSPDARRSLVALAKLLEDPKLKESLDHLDGTLANVEVGTKHAASTVETIDIATLPLREKASRVKRVIQTLLGLIKITVPLF